MRRLGLLLLLLGVLVLPGCHRWARGFWTGAAVGALAVYSWCVDCGHYVVHHVHHCHCH